MVVEIGQLLSDCVGGQPYKAPQVLACTRDNWKAIKNCLTSNLQIPSNHGRRGMPLSPSTSKIANLASTRIVVQQLRRSYATAKVHDPLRILFCGSDEFSITSLQALHAEHVRNESRIASIDVVCRPGKPTGRGLKVIRQGRPTTQFVLAC